MKKICIYVKSILIPVLTGILVGLITQDSINNNNLIQPRIAPPVILFPIVWTILYTLMGISYGLLKDKNLLNKEIKKIYYLQLVVNALWPIIFFNLELRLLAFFWIILLIILVVIMIDKFYFKNKLSGLLQIPYLIWLLFALYLSLSIYILNS